ncbi:MAG TPA: metal ABC transporter permease [Deltaproteobacteria bacterium]|nr:MAG: hypothetical protein A2048_11005 [Deltaproteobacteria bacterium GWA2_45_12]HBF13502.1 metal ABC transporter permease [Deltaproteobacteria bacterium]
MNILEFLLPSFVACLVLTGIHTYLGVHVIARGVIFVDIALAQLAALGMTVALALGHGTSSLTSYLMALSFSVTGAGILSVTRIKKIPQEAIIGVVFVVSSAAGILVADRSPHGTEHIKYILDGSILWVSWNQIIKTGIIYSLLGGIHYIFRKKMFLVSSDPDLAKKKGLKVKVWDFFFYVTFAVVITSSVQIGGILLVFSFLIVPALCSMLLVNRVGTILGLSLLVGWIVGILGSIIGISASYFLDLPTGSSIVVVFGIFLVGALLAAPLFTRRNQ